MTPGIEFYVRPYGPAAREVLRTVVAAAKSSDPMRPVTIVVPSNYAGLSLRRWLAANGREDVGARGVANVRFLVLARVIELLGAPRLAAVGRRPLTAAYRFEAVRAALDRSAGPFAAVSVDSAVLATLDRTFEDLARCLPAQVAAIAASGELQLHLVTMYGEYQRLVASFYDEHDLAAAAAAAVRDRGAAAGELGSVVLYLPGELTPLQRRFIEVLAEATDVAVALGATGDVSVDAATFEAWALEARPEAAIAPPGSSRSPRSPTATQIVRVADPEEEAREAVRQISARLAAGGALHRTAILYRHADPYARVVAEQLDAAGLPWNGPAQLTLGQTVAGRTLLGFLRLREQRFRREAVADWLNSAPILDGPNGEPAPPHRWEEIARSAGVVRGAEQWAERLDRFMRARQAERAAFDRDGDDDDQQLWRLGALERELLEAARLRDFMAELVERAGAIPSEGGSWTELAHVARDALQRYLGGLPKADAWPEAEAAAYRAVVEHLEELPGLDALDRSDGRHFPDTIERLLERPAGRSGQFGNGVFVGRLSDATGGDFDTVLVLGNTEGAMPPAVRDEPLLPEESRRQAGIEGRTARRRAERRDYLAALASAPERVLLFPRADIRGQRARLPGQWLLESASALAGERVFASRLQDVQGAAWFRDVASFEAALQGEGAAANEQEYDLRSLGRHRSAGQDVGRHYLGGLEPALARGWQQQRARRSRAFTRWDGAAPGAFPLAPLSPTALQNWAECPFRFFLAQVLRVAEREDPEETLVISALERGSLIHAVLDRFFKTVRERAAPDEPWSAEERALLQRLAREECEAAEAGGIAGRRLLWDLERERILADLDRLLSKDEALRSEAGTVQVASELAFGLDGRPPLEVQLPDGRQLLLRGRIDRLDRSPDGHRLLVIDYKTGRMRTLHQGLGDDPVQRGRLLQLPVYGLAARELSSELPDAEVETRYWFVTDRGGFAKPGYPLDGPREARFLEVLTSMAEGIEGGVFPVHPGPPGQGKPEHCVYCPYDRVCPADRARIWDRKRSDAALAGYAALAEPEAEQ